MMRSQLIFALLFFLFLTTSALAQIKETAEVKIKKSEFKTDNKEGFSDAWFNIREAGALFREGPGTYPEARELYLAAHQYNSENAELNYLIGITYLYTDDKYEAIRYLRKAYELKPKINPEIHYLMGRASHLNMDFDKAIVEYNAFLATLDEKEKAERAAHISKLIQECNDGKSLLMNRKRVIITNMGDSINSPYDDYGSIFTCNDSVLYFTSRRPGLKIKRNPYDNKFFEDIYTSRLQDGKWIGAVPIDKKINNSGNNAVVGVTRDGNRLFIYGGKENGGDVYTSDLKNGEWKRPDDLPSRLSSKQAETSVFTTITGDTIYFVSANEDLTLGNRDIMRSVRNKKGKWEKPLNLSSLINTPFDEEGIFITADGKEIYFSSKGHNTMGGYDVFRSRIRDDGSWSEPENMGFPINTPDDDLFFSLSANGKYAYYSSIRENGLGGKDIYKITFLGAEKELLLEKQDVLIAGASDETRKGFLTLPQPVGVDTFYSLTGRVLDTKTVQPVVAKLEFIDTGESKVIATAITTDSGVYSVKFTRAGNYGVEIIAKDYLLYLDAVNMTKASTDEPFIKDFTIEKIEVGTKVVLENIYFETGKAKLTVASNPQLNQVKEFLVNNESVRLEISGHTDNVGSLKVNTKLSDDRAKAVVDYLVANGIARSRLESKGYGFSQPIAPNNTADGREKNRRVEFKVISK